MNRYRDPVSGRHRPTLWIQYRAEGLDGIGYVGPFHTHKKADEVAARMRLQSHLPHPAHSVRIVNNDTKLHQKRDGYFEGGQFVSTAAGSRRSKAGRTATRAQRRAGSR